MLGIWKQVSRLRAFAYVLVWSLPFVSGAYPARGDDAVLLGGSRRPGLLRFRDEKFEFVPAGANAPLPWDQLDRVELKASTNLPPAPPFWWQATLTNGDHFACHVQEIESNAILTDSSWFQGLRVRRNSIRALERPSGWASWLRQDLSKEARGWKEVREEGDAPPTPGLDGLTLGSSFKSLQFIPESPLRLGKLSLQMTETLPGSGTRWRLLLGIDGDGAFHRIQILFDGNAPAEMQAPGLKVLRQDINGNHAAVLLQVEISEASIRLMVNGRLASWVERGFRDARLRSLGLEPDAPLAAGSPAKLRLQQFAVARRLEPLERPAAHPELDEVWLESGDQVFGSFGSLDSQYLELGTARQPRKILCSQVRGLYPKEPGLRDLPQPAPWRLTLLDPSGAEPSHLTGVIRVWGEREIIMIHPLLGQLKIPRSQVQAVAQAEPAPVRFKANPPRAIKP